MKKKKKKGKKRKGLRHWYVKRLKKYGKGELARVEKIRKMVDGLAKDMAAQRLGMK